MIGVDQITALGSELYSRSEFISSTDGGRHCVGNPDNLPFHDEYLEALEVPPTHLRVYRCDHVVRADGETACDECEGWPWNLDGYAVVDGKLALSGWQQSFPTWEAAIEGALLEIAEGALLKSHDRLCDDDGWDHPGPCVVETELPADPDDPNWQVA
jgi:hypothetical protein